MAYKSGFFSLIGCPNVGKSTLINALVGQKISIVTDRAQTTRNRITGVVTRDEYQMIFLDTPGMTVPKNRLGEYMQKTADDCLMDVEAILFLVDARKGVMDRDKQILSRLKKARCPVVVLLNKCDISTKLQLDEARQAVEAAGFDNIHPISAFTGKGLQELEELLQNYLVEGPQYFPPDMVTDQPERLICAEMIREKALELLKDEVPHGIGVSMDKMQLREDKQLMDCYATILCERESHKGIIIGKGGAMLKKIGSEARKDMEWLLGMRVNLQLWVKIKDDWRNRQSVLNELGYE
ncbi:MAG: GTPase Era [Clostridia bacterium]|nr:GTPase Era [Clostridia bacterium]